MSCVTQVQGDLFRAPKGAILVHACNTKGSWGAGIALAFRERFPEAFLGYKHCCEENGDTLVGTCLLLQASKYTIACLFTSRAYGRRKDKPDQILEATKLALEDLVRQNDEGKEIHAWCVLACLRLLPADFLQPVQFGKVWSPMGAHTEHC